MGDAELQRVYRVEGPTSSSSREGFVDTVSAVHRWAIKGDTAHLEFFSDLAVALPAHLFA